MVDHSARDFFDWLGIVASVIAAVGTPVAIAMLYLMLRGLRASRTVVIVRDLSARHYWTTLEVTYSIGAHGIGAVFAVTAVELLVSYDGRKNVPMVHQDDGLIGRANAIGSYVQLRFNLDVGEECPAEIDCSGFLSLTDGTTKKLNQCLRVRRD